MSVAILRGIADFFRLRWRHRHLRGAHLARFQRKALTRLVRLAIAGSPFYRELYAGREPEDFASLPGIDKAVMMREFDRINTVGLRLDEAMPFALEAERSERYLGYFRDRYVLGLSSGTSGARGLYVTDRTLTQRLPFAFLARSGLPWRLLPFRIAFFLRVFNQGFQDINGPGIHLHYLPTMLPIEQAIERLNALRANVLMGPPSLLLMLARARERIDCPIGIVVSYAEVLEDHERAMLERRFGVPVIEIYQASEGLIACPCSSGRLHINEDLVYVELLDAEDRPIERAGIPCHRMLVTNLYNEVQPLIRYELNDLVELGPPCECGSAFRVIARVIGRSDDILYFESAQGGVGHVFPDVISRWIITASEGVVEYVVEQPEPGRLAVELELEAADSADTIAAAIRSSIAQGLARHGLRPPSIEFRLSQQPLRLGPGKFKRFRRSFVAPGPGDSVHR